MRRVEDIYTFKKRFKEARGDTILYTIAKNSGISEKVIRQYAAPSCDKTPGIGNLKKLAAVLGVSPEWLAGETPYKTRMEEGFARFKNPETIAGGKAIRLIYQAIEELAAVHGYDLGIDPDVEVDGGLGYDGKGIALHLAALFERELENQCDLHLKKKEIPHPE